MTTRVSIAGPNFKREEKKGNNMTTTNSELRINVNSLKRVDPYIKEILETATVVALYNFNQENNAWEKTDIEGALFVYSRMGEPYNSFLIMNRLSTKNQVEPVTPGLDLQLQEPFLLYKNSKGLIYGIWFYDADECVRISSMLNKVVRESDSTNKVQAPKIKKPVQKKANNVDIFSMLSKAQEDYDSTRTCSGERGGKSPMSNALGELSGAISAMNMSSDVTSKSVMDFFAKAKSTKPPPQTGNVINEKPFLHQLMSYPTAHTVEHIEKQQRSVSPQSNVSSKQQSGMMMNNSSCENSIISKLRNKMPPQSNKNASFNQSSSGYPNILSRSDLSSKTNTEPDQQNNSSFLRIQSPTNSFNNSIRSNLATQHKNNTVPNFADAFESMHKQNNVSNSSVSFDAIFPHSSTIASYDEMAAPHTPKSASATGPALIPPGMFAAPSPATAEPLHRPIEPLTRNQLLQAFNYLLRTDPEFVNKLHEAYVKSFSEILS